MATVNITADQNEVDHITISDAAAEVGNHLFAFFTDGEPAFNIASQGLSGAAVDEVTVVEDTSYAFDITAEQAQLLNGAVSTYKHYLIADGTKALKNEGSVTVTPLEGTELTTLNPWVNGDRIIKSAAAALVLTAEHDILQLNPAGATYCTLPDARKMPGKRFIIVMTGAGSISVKKPDNSELIAMDHTYDSCEIRAIGLVDGNDWLITSRYIQA